MTFLSLFAGVGGFDLALTRLGMRCAGQVEIDPLCRLILERHFPEVPRHDDVRTTIAWWHAQPRPRPRLDLVTAGFPCQDVSQAGRRAGLAGTRTGLFFDLARAIDALSPRWLLLENVPGLLTSNHGEDFQTVLDTLDELGYGISWRVLDARHFRLAQRRRRVFLAGCRGAPCPFEVLFEPEGGRGDLAAGRPAGPPVAATLTAGAGATRRPRPAGRRREDDHNLIASATVAATLTASYGTSTPRGDGTDTLIVHPPPNPDPCPGSGRSPVACADGQHIGRARVEPDGASAPLYTIQGGGGYGDVWLTKAGPCYTLDSGHPHLLAIPAAPALPLPASAKHTTPTKRPAPAPAPVLPPAPVRARSFSQNQRGEVLTATVAASLGLGGGKPGQGYPAIMISTPTTPPRPSDPSGVVVAGTLTGRCGKGTNSTVDDGAIVLDLDADPPHQQGHAAIGVHDQHTITPAAPPTAGPASDGPHRHGQPGDQPQGRLLVTVRRLTPRECERLQGFPDDWTALDATGRPVADAARYRAMGNAVAVPVVAWIARRLLTVANTNPDVEAGVDAGAVHPARRPRPRTHPRSAPAANTAAVEVPHA
jgi:DNA (cytosine-5)-methyltransferase 1